jgi:hypothetical protein
MGHRLDAPGEAKACILKELHFLKISFVKPMSAPNKGKFIKKVRRNFKQAEFFLKNPQKF